MLGLRYWMFLDSAGIHIEFQEAVRNRMLIWKHDLPKHLSLAEVETEVVAAFHLHGRYGSGPFNKRGNLTERIDANIDIWG